MWYTREDADLTFADIHLALRMQTNKWPYEYVGSHQRDV
jgi:hypothetical protein